VTGGCPATTKAVSGQLLWHGNVQCTSPLKERSQSGVSLIIHAFIELFARRQQKASCLFRRGLFVFHRAECLCFYDTPWHQRRKKRPYAAVPSPEISHTILLEALAKEQTLKNEQKSRTIGFGA
jgi:hypothetical protein